MSSAKELVGWMKAAGEPSRIRLLALCSERDLSVTDLARALRQSGPRVSRHLKILCGAGLLERVRQGQWVHYQLPRDEAAVKFVRGILAQLDRNETVLVKDRQQARMADSGTSASTSLATAGSRLGRSMRSFIESNKSADRAESAIVIGARHAELLEAGAAVAGECVAVMPSRRAAQAARSFIDDHQLRCRTLISTPTDALEKSGPHDAVIIEHLNAPADALPPLLAAAKSAVRADGRVVLFAPYEALEGARGRVVEHPLARVRRLLSEAGLSCLQLSPIEADGEHVLAAVGVRAATGSAAAPASVA
jgi:DNA-binding transcriptional ArsR family regulator